MRERIDAPEAAVGVFRIVQNAIVAMRRMVQCCAHELELAAHLLDAAQTELAEPQYLFDPGVGRLD